MAGVSAWTLIEDATFTGSALPSLREQCKTGMEAPEKKISTETY
jgi:hypothetical protein